MKHPVLFCPPMNINIAFLKIPPSNDSNKIFVVPKCLFIVLKNFHVEKIIAE